MVEAARVLEPGGVAIFVTPNRLTLGRPDEIIDPYHYIEFDPDELRRICQVAFQEIELRGLFGSPRYMELFDEERRKLDRLLGLDPLRLRLLLGMRGRQWFYDLMLRRYRHERDPRAEAIEVSDFEFRETRLEEALDLCAICRRPQGSR